MVKTPQAGRGARLQPASVFDRLLDFEPDRLEEHAPSQREQLKRYKDSIRRDLEVLLNTQQPPQRLAERLPEIETSLVQFGSTGFHGLMLATREQHLALAKALQSLIGIFEPRLKNVKVILADDRARKTRSLNLRIKAETRFSDLDEPVVFDTRLDPSTRQFRIGETANG